MVILIIMFAKETGEERRRVSLNQPTLIELGTSGRATGAGRASGQGVRASGLGVSESGAGGSSAVGKCVC